MERDDLRWWNDLMGVHFPVSDADLASLGYVKLDGIDVDTLRGLVADIEHLHQLGSDYEPTEHRVLHVSNDFARQVLAAIDGEGA